MLRVPLPPAEEGAGHLLRPDRIVNGSLAPSLRMRPLSRRRKKEVHRRPLRCTP